MRPRRVVVLVFFCATADSRQRDEEWLTLDALAAPQNAAISAPRPALVRRCSAVSENSQLCAQLPANLRRYCANRRAASILSSKVLTVLRLLPRRERLITRPGIPSRTSACVVFGNLSRNRIRLIGRRPAAQNSQPARDVPRPPTALDRQNQPAAPCRPTRCLNRPRRRAQNSRSEH